MFRHQHAPGSALEAGSGGSPVELASSHGVTTHFGDLVGAVELGKTSA